MASAKDSPWFLGRVRPPWDAAAAMLALALLHTAVFGLAFRLRPGSVLLGALAAAGLLGLAALPVLAAWRLGAGSRALDLALRFFWTAAMALLSAAYLACAVSRWSWRMNLDRKVLWAFLPELPALAREAGARSFLALGLAALAPLAAFLLLRARGPGLRQAFSARPGRRTSAGFLALALAGAGLFADGARILQSRLLPFQAWREEPLLSAVYAESMPYANPDAAKFEALERDREARRSLKPVPPRRPHVILIVVDALRPDHLAAYGYSRPTSPFLDALARGGARLLTGYSHGTESLGGIASLHVPRPPRSNLPQGLSLGEAFSLQGFETRFLLSGMHDWFGLKAVYGPRPDAWTQGVDGSLAINDDRALLKLAEALPPAEAAKPRFLAFHLMSTHDMGVRLGQFDRWKPSASALGHYIFPKDEHDQAAAQTLLNDYDNRVLQADHILGRLWAILGAKGYLRGCVAAIVADHGQCLGEHGAWGHGRVVLQAALRVPLVFWSDSHLTLRPRRLIGLNDVGPTLLSLAGLAVPSSWDGSALDGAGRREWLAAEDVMKDDRWSALFWDSPYGLLKYVRQGRMDAAPQEELLFQLDQDPGELRNVLASAPEDVVKTMRAAAQARFSLPPAGP